MNEFSWGNWRLDRQVWVLRYTRAPFQYYEIDLEKIHSSAEMLDWIFQVRGRGFGGPEDMYDLLRAFHDLFQPQANLCSLGCDKRIRFPLWVVKRNMARLSAPVKTVKRTVH